MEKVKKAVILAAGFGTRVLPASKAIPKEMLNIVDKPAIQYIVEEVINSGITEILIVLSRGTLTASPILRLSSLQAERQNSTR